jgi:anti-sigma factor ChrR (cupin superfamily)
MKKTLIATLGFVLPALALAQTATHEHKAGTKKEKTGAKTEGAMPKVTTSPAPGSADHGLFKPGDLKWMDAPNALPAGAKLAVLEGDPFKPGLYTMRLQMPDGYKIPPHYHKQFEHVTVVSGSFNLGMGETFDDKAGQPMPAGTFGFLPPGMRHYAWSKGETVIQLHGMGPWEIVYVSASDDPRKKAMD